MKKILFVLAVIVLIVGFIPPVSSAALMQLDQFQTTVGGNNGVDVWIGTSPEQGACQTFTPDMSGQLGEADFYVNNFYPTYQTFSATVSIVETTGGVPNGTVLWTKNNCILTYGWSTVDTSLASPTLVQGTIYGIMVTTTDASFASPSSYWSIEKNTNLYANGQFFVNHGAGWDSTYFPSADAAFRTYMIVPEPSTIVMLSIGFIATIAGKFRRRGLS